MAILSIGILFNALVTGAVAATALALVIFFRQRWQRLDDAMRAYTWFWWFTFMVWGPFAVRYLFISFGYAGPIVHIADVMIQAGVFFTGPSLLYYLSLRVFRNRTLAILSATLSLLLGLVAMWFVLQPDGIPIKDVTYFSAEGTINSTSFIIFGAEAALIFTLLVFDMGWHLREWRRRNSRSQLYQALYSAAPIVYLAVGTVDESKIITDWPLVVFRMLYTGTFLFVYLIVTQDEASSEEYFSKGSPPTSYDNTQPNPTAS